MKNMSSEERLRLLAAYRSSKEPARLFCQRHKMSLSSLYYWLGKDKELQPSQVSMLPVIASEPKPIIAELVMPKGIILRFSPGTSARYMADIIKALA